ncbi:hypothetical protein CAPTEDRAFT_192842 [Capitella teleta]|uniref:CARD domain-containing protein n=1 Tax=Capitella teleta TaxID=283909 RepID=R7VF77_CAPTE|nr:hypothetical protein CAPTEDRAFT_192842 [Capitella teleta]|eukprot:ELU17264.1 hypothetical protein CAPTEDRAFT_192842 [Capitella teleta]
MASSSSLIESNRYTTEERISALLLRLVKRGPSAFSTFIRACSCSEQTHIADELTLNLTERNKTAPGDPKTEMSTLERAVLEKKRSNIMQLKLNKGFFDVIMEENIITQDMEEHIKVTKKLRSRTAQWCTNVANDQGEILQSVLIVAEVRGLEAMCTGIMKRYSALE